ncbi:MULTISPECIES: TraX family protein [Lysinibacillus]|nr:MULTISPECIES: TraX family protein [Lysinibacillus]
MLIDHIGYIFFPDVMILRMIGRLSFPLFAYGIAIGMKRTKDVKKYGFRLLILALISQLPYQLVFGTRYFNVLFTLFIGLFSLIILKANIKISIKISIIVGLTLISDLLNFEYGIYGVLLIICFYFCDNNIKLVSSVTILTLVGVIIYNYPMIQLFSILAVLIIPLQKKFDFKISKIVSYLFYPSHLILLWFIEYKF